jgi:hypothetical protein
MRDPPDTGVARLARGIAEVFEVIEEDPDRVHEARRVSAGPTDAPRTFPGAASATGLPFASARVRRARPRPRAGRGVVGGLGIPTAWPLGFARPELAEGLELTPCTVPAEDMRSPQGEVAAPSRYRRRPAQVTAYAASTRTPSAGTEDRHEHPRIQKPKEIPITGKTLAAIGARFCVAPPGERELEAKKQKVAAFEVIEEDSDPFTRPGV